MDLTWNRIVHHGKLFMSGWNFPSFFHTNSFPKEFWWVTAAATHRWLVFWLVLFAFAVIACYLSDGFSHLKCVWNSTVCLCVVLKNVWLCRGYYLSYGKKELSESRNCEAKQELKDPEAFQRNEFWRNSIFRKGERRSPEIGWDINKHWIKLLWNIMAHDRSNCANCLLSVQYFEHFKNKTMVLLFRSHFLASYGQYAKSI